MKRREKKQWGTRFDAVLLEKFQQQAADEFMSMTMLLERLMREYLREVQDVQSQRT